MSYLKLTLKTVLLGLVLTSLAACDNDGAFKAADMSIKEVGNNKPVLTEEQIKQLYADNQRMVKELREETDLKLQAISELAARDTQAQEQIEALSQRLAELIASENSSEEKTQEMLKVKAEMDTLRAQMESDRTQYIEAFQKVSKNEEVLIAQLVTIREELNRLKEKQGAITDEEILKMDSEITERIDALIQEQEDKRAFLDKMIASLEQQNEVLKNKITDLEAKAATAATPEEKEALESEILKAKEEEVKTQTVLNESIEDLNNTNNNIVVLKCEDPADCENVDVNVEGVGNSISVTIADELETKDSAEEVKTTDEAQAVVTTEVVKPVETTEVLEPVEGSEADASNAVAQGTETPKTSTRSLTLPANEVSTTALTEVEARRAERLEANAKDIAFAEEGKKALLAEIEELKAEAADLRKQHDEIDNKIFDEALRKEAAANDVQRVEIENNIKALNEQRRQVLNLISSANTAIQNIQQGDLVQMENHLKELRRKRTDIMRR